jgi:formylglycine-generating enzyme required for sulfatase activity
MSLRRFNRMAALTLWLLACCGSGTAISLEPGASFKECADCPTMMVVPAGSFTMGFEGGEEGRYEGPVRKVTVGKSFAVGLYEVTQAEYRAFVEATGRTGPAGCNVLRRGTNKLERDESLSWRDPGYGRPPRDDDPVACISWDDAQAYVAWLRRISGQPYRLLTEAEWEYVARAGSASAYPWGEDPDQACLHGNVYDRSGSALGFPVKPAACDDGYEQIAPVGRFRANRFGLHDLVGNVWEWVEDCYEMPYGATPVDGSAQRLKGCDRRGSRGGGWRSDVSRQRPSFRGRDPSTLLSAVFGLRVARDLSAP